MKDVPIRKTITYNGYLLKAKAQSDNTPNCKGCFFTNKSMIKHGFYTSCAFHGLACTPHNRRDRRHVVFEKVECDNN